MRFLIFIIFVGCTDSCSAQTTTPKMLASNRDGNSLLWEISGNGVKKPSYLFGTFHLMCSNDIHFSENLKTALISIDEVYFEMDLDDLSEMMSAFFLMNMKHGQTLKDLYDSANYVKVQSFFQDTLLLPFVALQKIKPAFLESMLYTKMLPCALLSGVEEELLKIATANKKEVRGFETMAFQAAIFDSIPYQTQAGSLLQSIDSLQWGRVEFQRMLETYKMQQLDSLEVLMKEGHGLDAKNEELLLTRRNKNWVVKINTILKSKAIFAGVGAGHLIGKDGLLSLLKKEGYMVRPIWNR